MIILITSKLDSLKDSVTEALSDVINLTSKLTNTKKNLPDKLPDNPMELSFWIGAHLGGPVAEEQQRLLRREILILVCKENMKCLIIQENNLQQEQL